MIKHSESLYRLDVIPIRTKLKRDNRGRKTYKKERETFFRRIDYYKRVAKVSRTCPQFLSCLHRAYTEP